MRRVWGNAQHTRTHAHAKPHTRKTTHTLTLTRTHARALTRTHTCTHTRTHKNNYKIAHMMLQLHHHHHHHYNHHKKNTTPPRYQEKKQTPPPPPPSIKNKFRLHSCQRTTQAQPDPGAFGQLRVSAYPMHQSRNSRSRVGMHVRTKRPFVDCNMDTFRGHLWSGYGYSTIGVGWDMDPIPFAAICGLRMDFLLVVIYD